MNNQTTIKLEYQNGSQDTSCHVGEVPIQDSIKKVCNHIDKEYREEIITQSQSHQGSCENGVTLKSDKDGIGNPDSIQSKIFHKVYTQDKRIYTLKQYDKFIHDVKLTARQREIWSVLRENDFNNVHTAQKMGVSETSIRGTLKRIRSRVKKYMNNNNIDTIPVPFVYINKNSVCSLYESGQYSLSDIGKMFGVSKAEIGKITRNKGVSSPTYSKYDNSYTIEDARRIFKEKDITLLSTEYTGVRDKMKCMCSEGHINEYSLWQVNMNMHSCLECRKLGGGNYTLKRAERHKEEWKKEKGYVYMIHLSDENESFYKIGMTVDFERRKYCFPYNVEIIQLYEMDLYSACYVEDVLLEQHKNKGLQYLPQKEFGGETECFVELKIEQEVF